MSSISNKKLKIKGFRRYIFFCGCRVGFFIALPSRIVAAYRLRLLGSVGSLLCGVSLKKRTHRVLFLRSPTPSAAATRLSAVVVKNPTPATKMKRPPDWVAFSFCVRTIKKILSGKCLRDLNLTSVY